MRLVTPPARFTDAFNQVEAAQREHIDRVRDRAAFILRRIEGRGVDITRPWSEVVLALDEIGCKPVQSAHEDEARYFVANVVIEHLRLERARQFVEAEEARRDADAEVVAAEALAELRPEQRRALVRLSSRLGGLLDGRAAPEEDE